MTTSVETCEGCGALRPYVHPAANYRPEYSRCDYCLRRWPGVAASDYSKASALDFPWGGWDGVARSTKVEGLSD